MDSFDLRKFLIENKLTSYSKLTEQTGTEDEIDSLVNNLEDEIDTLIKNVGTELKRLAADGKEDYAKELIRVTQRAIEREAVDAEFLNKVIKAAYSKRASTTRDEEGNLDPSIESSNSYLELRKDAKDSKQDSQVFNYLHKKLIESDVDLQSKKEFMDLLNQDVLISASDLTSSLGQKVSLDSIIPSRLLSNKFFASIKEDLLNQTFGTGGSANNSGKGEVFLFLLGKDAQPVGGKSTGGDISIEGVTFEIKDGRGKGMPVGFKAAKANFGKAIPTFYKDLDLDPEDYKDTSHYAFRPYDSVVQDRILKLGSKGEAALSKMFNTAYSGNSEVADVYISGYYSLIKARNTNKADYQKLQVKLSYEGYRQNQPFDYMLVYTPGNQILVFGDEIPLDQISKFGDTIKGGSIAQTGGAMIGF